MRKKLYGIQRNGVNMAKVKEVTLAVKKGQPNYGSIFASVTMTVEEGDKLDTVWNTIRQELDRQCTMDQASTWVDKKITPTGGKE